MYVASQSEMQMLDAFTIENIGLPGTVLMENAGNAVAQEIIKDFPKRSTKAVVLAGGGNNGGDGIVIARRLSDFGYSVILCLLIPEGKLKGDAKVHYEVYKRRKLPLIKIEEMKLEEIKGAVENSDLIIDAMLGTGMKGEVRSPMKELIVSVNELEKSVYCVDLPSGLDADTGRVANVAIKATKTITFALPKRGFFLKDGPSYIGDWSVANISVSVDAVYELNLNLPKLLNELIARQALPKRRATGHKGTFGHCLVVGGCQSFVGAPIYTAKAAFFTGVGLVSLAIPEVIYPVVASQCSEALLYPISKQNGGLDNIDLNKIKTIAFGPGLGRHNEGRFLWKTLFSKLTNQTLIIDADGLYFTKENLQDFKDYKGKVIFTPHPGEMAALLDISINEVEDNRIQVAQDFAMKYGIFLVLKGHRSILATPEGEVWINPVGNDSLGKGGSGDVLTGLIASFATQGATPLEAIQAASFFHGKAGEMLSKQISNYGVTPMDVIEYIRHQL